MTRRTEIGLIYLAGLVQGLALVTFPAASSIFTSPQGYGFSSTQYGAMFLPQVVLAILASSLSPVLARRWTLKRVFMAGLTFDLVAMALLALSQLLVRSPDLAYGVLLLATAALGLGFGAAVMALNTFAQAFFPGRADSAVLAMNALLGTGTALAPVFVAVFVALGAWWLLPLVVGAALLLLLLFGLAAPLQVAADHSVGGGVESGGGLLQGLPRRFWWYAAVVVLYGICETLNGNWATLYLTRQGVPPDWASLALTAFWAMVTIGRILFAVVSSKLPARWIYLGLPVLLAGAFLVVARADTANGGVIAFGFAGLACSAFLPLSISFGGQEFPRLAAVVSGGLIAFYQVGYGIAAFGAGPLQEAIGLPLSAVYTGGSLVAAAMFVLAFFVTRGMANKISPADQ
jgi:MFS family permease